MQTAGNREPARPWAILHARWTDGPGDAIPLTRPTIRIGRLANNDLVVERPSISGSHLEIAVVSGGVQARDLGSLNGTFLDNRRLPPNQPVLVGPGSVLRLGTALEIVLTPPDAGASASAMPAHVRLLPRPRPGLVIQSPGAPLQLVVLEPGDRPVRIGRRSDNDIVIDSPLVSGQHAEISRGPGGELVLTDLDSANGISSQGQRVKSKVLLPGDFVTIGRDVLVRFRPDMAFVSQESGFAAQDDAPETRQSLQLSGQERLRIGRADDNDIRVNDERVSRYHAVVERLGQRYRIRDLRSHNGTFVNDQRVDREQFIVEGDVIQVAATRLRIAVNAIERMDSRDGLRLDAVNLRKVVSSGQNLLQDISLSIYPREFVALVGTSGAGKSTLLDAMNGYRPASAGHVYLNGQDLYRHFDAYRGEMGYVPQEDIMHRELTLQQALDFAAQLRMPPDTTPAERRTRIAAVLRELDLEASAGLPIHKLSGGQRKRVSIAIELLTRPRLFFLDEATSGLDPGTELELMMLLRKITEDPNEARTVVLITHATKNVMLCDKVIFLTKGGYLAFYGPPDEALAYFDRFRTQEARRLKPTIEFDDIYLLIDPDRALPEKAPATEKSAIATEWARRYRQSAEYQKYVVGRLREGGQNAALGPGAGPSTQRGRPGAAARPGRASAWRQLRILTARSATVIRHDRRSLAVMLAQAPLIGLLSFVDYGSHMYNRVDGAVDRALTSIFMITLIVMLFGIMNGVREISRETAIYRRERLINLRIGPYVFSKILICGAFCLYQVGLYLAFTLITVDWPRADLSAFNWLQIYITLFMACLSGALLGLTLSALAPNESAALALIPLIFIPQLLFAGVLRPDRKPAPLIPHVITSKWTVQALATITRADRAGSLNPELAASAAGSAALAGLIKTEGDRAVAAQLDGLVQAQLPAVVQQKTDEVVAEKTKAAQDQATAAVQRELSKMIIQPLPSERDRQIALARQKAADQVAAARPEIEAAVRQQAEPALRDQISSQIRAEVEKRVREGGAAGGSAENLVVKAARDRFGSLFEANVYAVWARLSAIMGVLVVLILWLQKRKDIL